MVSRRTFLKAAVFSAAAAAFGRGRTASAEALPQGPDSWVGRVAWPWDIQVLSRPRPGAAVVRSLAPEDLVVIRREVVGVGLMPHNHVWFELDDGFVYAAYVQPARNWLQTPPASLPAGGLWSEVSVPFVEGRARPAADAAIRYRLYYGGVFRAAQIVRAPDGAAWYRVGTEVVPEMYAPAEAFRLIAPEEVTPLSPQVTDKRVVVDLSRQSLTAWEGRAAVFRARISSGARYFGSDGKTLVGGTGLGERYIWQKRVARHMQGGNRESGWDLPGVGWVSYFASNGEALHSAYWHNDFGRPKSRGCINLRPEDAKWLWRWTTPAVAYSPGDMTVDWDRRGTLIDIRWEA